LSLYYRLESMFSKRLDYPIIDTRKPFADYINQCRSFIAERRADLQTNPEQANTIIEANTPFEFFPSHTKWGALLIHGLLDSPFSLRDTGAALQSQGIYCRSILLPGHGTVPSDLHDVSHLDWINAVRAGVTSMQQEVEHLYLVGYSTGAALSILEAMQSEDIAGIILLSPAVKIKPPVSYITLSRPLLKFLSKQHWWIWHEKEIDYVKYLSIAFNAVRQVSLLTDKISAFSKHHKVKCPIFMSLSREDETICSHHATEFFSSTEHPDSELLLYSMSEKVYPDKRIQLRLTKQLSSHVKNFSHISIPFAPNNPHYGQNGDYIRASDFNQNDVTYGAFSRGEVDLYRYLYKMGFVKKERRELTFNPDFDFLADKITQFIKR
jgi:esterase/lipase